MDGHKRLPLKSALPPRQGNGQPGRETLQEQLRVATTQVDVLTAVIRFLLDGDPSAAAELIRAELDRTPEPEAEVAEKPPQSASTFGEMARSTGSC